MVIIFFSKRNIATFFFDLKALSYPLLQQDYFEGPHRDEPFQEFFTMDPRTIV